MNYRDHHAQNCNFKKDQEKLFDVTIPDFPLEEKDITNFDLSLMSRVAADYAQNTGNHASNPEFFLGYLPIWSAGNLSENSQDSTSVHSLLGNFVISGYFGGIWLRDALGLTVFQRKRISKIIKSIGRPFYTMLTSLSRKMVEVGVEGSNSRVLLWNRLSIEPFVFIYGYNWAYFNYVLNNPPRGTSCPEQYKAVAHRYLDCRMPFNTPSVMDRYKPVLEKLYPPAEVPFSKKRWRELNFITRIISKFSGKTGDLVWHILMNDSMSASLYELLLDLSGRFMLVAELCLLPAMEGYAESDSIAGRCAILQQAAMILWGGSYFLGLASDLPPGTFPDAGFSA